MWYCEALSHAAARATAMGVHQPPLSRGGVALSLGTWCSVDARGRPLSQTLIDSHSLGLP
jgi:hypothetical protein